MISVDEIQHIAHLSKLELRPGEAEFLGREISAILGYLDSIKKIEIDSRLAHEGALNVLREDEVHEFGDRDALLEAMPRREGDSLKVHKILSQDE